ncbi:MAG: ribose 5-phosphate isomerase B [Flavobacteriales bacterium]|nr:ribose 5-phosphate isomerase B [Flavobacteriales bacterium]
MKIAIGSDHAGFELKEKLKNRFEFEFVDFGTSSDESVDYPDYAHAVADALTDETFDFGILICGSGNGIAMTANKHSHIRAAICWTTEIAELARSHNDANVVVLPARFLEIDLAFDIVKTFMENSFEGGRHQRRRDKIVIC